MALKILHTADLHLDSPFEALSPEKAAQRRQEQRALLDKLAAIVNEEGVDVVLMAGDLLDSARSYRETHESLLLSLSRMNARVFISPGNHDYYTQKSPYAFLKFPDNVHIFRTPDITAVELPELGCRIFGAGFGGRQSGPLLQGFAAPQDELLNIMVLHGELSGEQYNPIREAEIEASNLHYLALGHVHAYSGLHQAGRTYHAYPGCPEGRGFDETGEKGVLIGTVSRDGCDLRLRPIAARQYKILRVDCSESVSLLETVHASLPGDTEKDIYRIVLTGRCADRPDTAMLLDALSSRFFHLSVLDETTPTRDLWEGAGDDSLRGLFLERLRQKYDAARNADERDEILRAVRFGLAALDNMEEACV
jgi:DNA repair exonuclease SbcCD nuclease subunit